MALSLSTPTSPHVFSAGLAVLVLSQCLAARAFPAGLGAVTAAICALMLVFVTANTLRFVCAKPAELSPEAPPPDVSAPSDEDIENAPPDPPLLRPTAVLEQHARLRRDRLHYLDNLKVFLTVLVIVHHQTCSFTGGSWYFNVGNYPSSFQAVGKTFLAMNQSYFMCLFFFISGYFTPTSFERKGRQLFLRDKFQRLGIPVRAPPLSSPLSSCQVPAVLRSNSYSPVLKYVLFAFVLSPLLGMIYGSFAGHGAKWNPTPNPGPLWFTGWLLVSVAQSHDALYFGVVAGLISLWYIMDLLMHPGLQLFLRMH